MNKKRTFITGGAITIVAAASLVVLALPSADTPRATIAPASQASVAVVPDPSVESINEADITQNTAIEASENGQTSTTATNAAPTPQNPSSEGQTPNDQPAVDPPAAPKQIGKELQLRDRPGNDAMVDAYCVLSFDDGTTTETYVGGKPKATQHGVDVQFDC